LGKGQSAWGRRIQLRLMPDHVDPADRCSGQPGAIPDLATDFRADWPMHDGWKFIARTGDHVVLRAGAVSGGLPGQAEEDAGRSTDAGSIEAPVPGKRLLAVSVQASVGPVSKF